jgi:hypothetical protein
MKKNLPPIFIRVDRRVRASDTADINVTIRNAIQEETDCVIIFLGRETLKPEWVRRDSEWVLEREKFLSNNA